MIGQAGFMAASKSDPKERIVRRMEHIREQLDEDGDLSTKERKLLVAEYRLLSGELMRRAGQPGERR